VTYPRQNDGGGPTGALPFWVDKLLYKLLLITHKTLFGGYRQCWGLKPD